MSQQYQNSKQTFINRQYSSQFHQYNTNEINQHSLNHKPHHHLTIQQQSHYPFQQFQEQLNPHLLKHSHPLIKQTKTVNLGLNQINYQHDQNQTGFHQESQSNVKSPNYFSSNGNLNHPIQMLSTKWQEKQPRPQSNSKSQNNLQTEPIKIPTPYKQLPIIYASPSPKSQPNKSFMPIQNIHENSNNPNSLSPNSRIVMQSQPQGIIMPGDNCNMPVMREQSRIIMKQQKPNMMIGETRSNPISFTNNYYPARVINSNQPQRQLVIPFSQHPPNEQFISLNEYERLRGQCAMWQQKCVQLQSMHGTELVRRLKDQNGRLLERIRQLESEQKQSIQKIQQGYQIILQKYQQSLTKQTELLLDRCRLEMKQIQGHRSQTLNQFYK